MKFSSKVKKCGLSPMRKFHPYAVAAGAKGRKIYHLNIGQPDVETPPQFFEAVRISASLFWIRSLPWCARADRRCSEVL